MNNFKKFSEFINENFRFWTYDGKKPMVFFSVQKLDYKTLATQYENTRNILLPSPSGNDTISLYAYDINNTSLEKKFNDWKSEVLKNWPNIGIYLFNDNSHRPVFKFTPGTSDKWDAEVARINGIKNNTDLSNFYDNKSGTYYGD